MSAQRDELGRYVKGTSGNGNGRPKGAKNHKTWFLDVIGEPVTVAIDGKRRKLPKIAVMYMAHMNKAVQGNVQSARFIAAERDRLGVLDEFEKMIDFSKDSELLNTYRGVLKDSSVKPVASEKKNDFSFLD